MKRSIAILPIVFLLMLVSPVRAAAPTTDASAFGIELCPQYICGSAIFTGILSGEVAGVHTSFGSFAVSVTHDPLPTEVGGQAAITGGVFELRAGTRTIRGVVAGGTLTYLGNNEFGVQLLLVARNGSTMTFEGILSHNTFPPTIAGRIVSTP